MTIWYFGDRMRAKKCRKEIANNIDLPAHQVLVQFHSIPSLIMAFKHNDLKPIFLSMMAQDLHMAITRTGWPKAGVARSGILHEHLSEQMQFFAFVAPADKDELTLLALEIGNMSVVSVPKNLKTDF